MVARSVAEFTTAIVGRELPGPPAPGGGSCGIRRTGYLLGNRELETALRHASRALHVYPDEDGMVVLRGRLEPEVGALLMQALAAARETLYQRARVPDVDVGHGGISADTPTLAQRQAEALAQRARPWGSSEQGSSAALLEAGGATVGKLPYVAGC